MKIKHPHIVPDEIKWFIIEQDKAKVRRKIIKDKVFKKFRRRVTYGTMKRICDKYKKTKSIADLPRSGRPEILCEREKRNLVRDFLTAPGLSIRQVVKESQGTAKPLSRRTVRRTLRSRGLVPKVSEQGKEITEKNKTKRVKFAKNHQVWDITDWSRIVFSDEATLYPMRTRTSVRWVMRGTAGPPPQEDNFEKNSVNVWAYINYEGTGRIFKFDGTMNKTKYKKMLQRNLFIALEDPDDSDDELTYMQDGASYHRAKLVKDWLRDNDVDFIEWPAQSPDLNPIENVWALVRNELWKRRKEIKTNRDTWRLSVEIFNNMSLQYIRKLYNSMPKRVDSVIKLKGNRTNY